MTLGGGEYNYQANRKGQEQRDAEPRRPAKGMQWGQGVTEGEISLGRRQMNKEMDQSCRCDSI